jgi:hypothetical protein
MRNQSSGKAGNNVTEYLLYAIGKNMWVELLRKALFTGYLDPTLLKPHHHADT